ncbi:MAG: hypothetical protein PWQ63_628 [Methanolobus sp.]|jgi:hypothetical protein|nr:hypothetical protein [Methanolobus sp.]
MKERVDYLTDVVVNKTFNMNNTGLYSRIIVFFNKMCTN